MNFTFFILTTFSIISLLLLPLLFIESPNQFHGSSYYGPSAPQFDFGPPTTQNLSHVSDTGKPVYLTTTRPSLPTMHAG